MLYVKNLILKNFLMCVSRDSGAAAICVMQQNGNLRNRMTNNVTHKMTPLQSVGFNIL